MIGRAAIGHPEIFSKITGTKFTRSYKDYLRLAKKFKLPFKQLKFQAMQFTKGNKGSKKLREEIFRIKNSEELEKVI
jgi:tRNA-dihydrouridine synthase